MKNKEELRLSTLRFLLAALHNAKIEKRQELSDEDIVSAVQRQIKQRKESIEGFEKGGRVDLAEKEQKELSILQEYLPEQLSETEIEQLVDKTVKDLSASSITDMGKVMGKLSGELKGKADMGVVSSLVKKRLS